VRAAPVLAFATLALLAGGAWATLGAPAQPGIVAFADLAVEDPDLAKVVGLAQGPSLMGLPLGAAPARVLAVPQDAPADLSALEPTGRTFAFTDPHGNAWLVEELQASWGFAYATQVGPLTHDADAGAYNFVLLVDHAKAGRDLRLVAA
jgi:hypothetical protein